VGVNYNIDQYLGAYIAAAQKAICNLTAEANTAAKYDKPCKSYDERIQEGLFLKFCLENIDCFADNEKNKIISKANRFAQNCGFCTVSQSEINAFAETDLGVKLGNKFELDADVKAFVDAASIKDSSQIKALSDLVKSLKDENLWSKFHVIYPFVGDDLTAKSYNLKDAAKHTINWGSGAIYDSKGVDFDGSLNSYGDTNMNFHDLGYTTIQDLHVSFYTPDDRDTAVRCAVWGAVDDISAASDRITMVFDSAALGGYYFVDFWADNDSASRLSVGAGTDPGDKGFYIVSTSSASDLRIIKDKSIKASFTSARDIDPTPDLDLYIGTINWDDTINSSVPSTRKMGFFTAGTNLTNTEANKFSDIVMIYINALSRA